MTGGAAGIMRSSVRMLLGWMLVFGAAACTPNPTPTPIPAPIEKAIVGKWVNAQGGAIHFYADKTGFIPGLPWAAEPIPDSRFTYYFPDKTHVGITAEGQPAVVVEIKIESDQMMWRGLTGREYLYHRAK